LIKNILIILTLVNFLFADKVIKETLACPTLDALKKVPLKNGLDLNMYAIANNCIVLNRYSDVKAIGYDNYKSKDIYQKIIFNKTGAELYMKKSALQIEEGGKKNILRF